MIICEFFIQTASYTISAFIISSLETYHGFTWVYIIFLITIFEINYGQSLEPLSKAVIT